MSTPANQKTGEKKKTTPRQNQAKPKGQPAASKGASAAPKPERAAPRPAQNAGKPAQAAPKAASQPPPKAGPAPAPKAATPPAPKPRDPSVARRDEGREARRLLMQTRQQERGRELRQAKRQTLLIRYDLIIAPILLIILVALFLVIHQPTAALIAGLLVLFGGFTVLAFAAFTQTSGPGRRGRARQPALQEAEVVDSTLSADAQPPAAQADEEADSKPAQ